MRRAWPVWVVWLACAAPVPSGVQPLVLPESVGPTGPTGVMLAAWVYGLPRGEEPPVVGTNGILQSFVWGGGPNPGPPGAQYLEVTTSSVGGVLSVQVRLDGGVAASNRVRVESTERVVAEPPRVPQLVPGRPGTGTVLIVASDFGSGRLVDARGAELPAGAYSCDRSGSPALREAAMRCTVTLRGPLEPQGYSGSAVRAVVQTPEGPVLTPAVVVP